jgi:cytochrome c biogenesis protein CcmG/thiol:disulfide interchange protein DsbE
MDRNDDRELDRAIAERFSAFRVDDDWQPNVERSLAKLRQRQRAIAGKRRLLLVFAIASCLSVAAFPGTRAFAEQAVYACVQQSSKLLAFLAGDANGPAPSSTYIQPEARKTAADFMVRDASGKAIRLSDFRGKAVLLNFWATGSDPSKVEIPILRELQQAYGDRGLTVLGVSIEREGWNVVSPYMEKTKFNYPVMVADAEVAALYGGLKRVPTTLLIDATGRIAAVHVGVCSRGEYEGEIDAVLKGR